MENNIENNIEEGIMYAEISNNSVDMSGDVCLPQGCDASLWLDNPMFFDDHDDKKPLGYGIEVNRNNDSVFAKLKFSIDADKNSDLYKRAFNTWTEYKSKAKRKFSVGFVPLEVSTNPKVCKKYGENCKKVISKWLLIEVSTVTLPDNFKTRCLDMKKMEEIYGDKIIKKNLKYNEIMYKSFDAKELEQIKTCVEEVIKGKGLIDLTYNGENKCEDKELQICNENKVIENNNVPIDENREEVGSPIRVYENKKEVPADAIEVLTNVNDLSGIDNCEEHKEFNELCEECLKRRHYRISGTQKELNDPTLNADLSVQDNHKPKEDSVMNDMTIKPYPNEISARLVNPDKFKQFRRANNAGGKGVDFIYGITENGDVEIQSIRFDASKFTSEEAHNWLKNHDKNPIEFAPATDKGINNEGNDAGDIVLHKSLNCEIAEKALNTYKPVIKYKSNINMDEVELKRIRGKIYLK